jgi:hypothetical protein
MSEIEKERSIPRQLQYENHFVILLLPALSFYIVTHKISNINMAAGALGKLFPAPSPAPAAAPPTSITEINLPFQQFN